ncbi:MAG: Na+:solute symporter [Cyclobacteriaceae bacterium]|nr:Na+:solute symporter [Cyclobacteriaceae bacterium]
MANLDIWTISLFSLVVFITGISFAKSGNNMKSFFAAGGSVPYWISGLSLFMSFFSAGTFVVWGSIAYTDGLVAIIIQWTMCLAGVVIAILIAPGWNRTKAMTAAQFITERLGYDTQKVYTYLFLFISIVTTGAFLYPVARIVEVSTGIPLQHSIIALGLMITIYTTVGGLWAVIVTDVLQFIVLTAAVLIVVPLALDKVGGFSNFSEMAPEGFFSLISEEYNWWFIVAMVFYHIVYIGGNWAYVQRYTTVATPRESTKVAWLFSGLYLISPVVWMLPPMIYRVMNPELSGLADEGAYLLICKDVLPAGLMGLMLGGMIFATSSSVNTTINISAGVFTNDIYGKLWPHTSQKTIMHVARFATIGFGILTIVVALLVPNMGGIVEVVLSVAALTGGAMFLPPIWALFSRHQTGVSIVSATLFSLSINIFFKMFAPRLLDITLSRSSEMLTGVVAPALVLVIFELYYRIKTEEVKPYQLYLMEREKRMEKEGTAEGAIGQSNKRGMKIIGTGIMAIGLMVIGLGILADFAHLLVISMGIAISLVAAMIFPWQRKIN